MHGNILTLVDVLQLHLVGIQFYDDLESTLAPLKLHGEPRTTLLQHDELYDTAPT